MVDVTDPRVLAVLTRAPSAGGKSRLFAGLGRSPDPALLEALLLDTIENAAPDGVRVVVAVTPDTACDEIRDLLSRTLPRPRAGADLELGPGGAIPVIPQGGGDLGDRMRGVMTSLFAHAGAIALIGSDLPHLSASNVAAAFDILESDRDALVLGPATDGGYYLIAAARVPEVFDGIDWGGKHVFEQTRRAAVAGGFHVRRLPALGDVDTVAELRAVVRHPSARRTAAWCGRHVQPVNVR
jgi:glycosyltransferase A (GT-A) superfamily protein (DUF2064 family)